MYTGGSGGRGGDRRRRRGEGGRRGRGRRRKRGEMEEEGEGEGSVMEESSLDVMSQGSEGERRSLLARLTQVCVRVCVCA